MSVRGHRTAGHGNIQPMAPHAAKAPPDDPTVYPVEERVGEGILQRWIIELFRPLLGRWFAERGIVAFVGADQFIYFQQHDSTKRVAPDVYVLPGVAPDTDVTAWKIWDAGIAPSFALEVVSTDWEKDYAQAPGLYDQCGASELVIFDPWFKRRPRGEGLMFQIYRRLPRRGFVRVEVTNEYRVRSKILGCFLRAVGSGRTMRLRIGTGQTGELLFPTAEEHERAEKERERAEKERERAEKERERAEKERALCRVAELEAELRADRGRPGRGKRKSGNKSTR